METIEIIDKKDFKRKKQARLGTKKRVSQIKIKSDDEQNVKELDFFSQNGTPGIPGRKRKSEIITRQSKNQEIDIEEVEVKTNLKRKVQSEISKKRRKGKITKHELEDKEMGLKDEVEEENCLKSKDQGNESNQKKTTLEAKSELDDKEIATEKQADMCKTKLVMEAITVLRQLNDKFFNEETKKQPLLEEATESPVMLQVTLVKIPPKQLKQIIMVKLPNSLITNTSEVCLITGDLDKRNTKAEIAPDVLHYKELLKQQEITNVTEVITLRQLRTEYHTYESKRQLVAAYDVFLCDKKIAQCLPRLLGKEFFGKRRIPIQINMQKSNLKNEIERALAKTQFHLTCRGNNCTSEVALLCMEDDEILENITTAVKTLVDKLPGKSDNILGVYIKTPRSKSLPIYMSFGNPNDVKLKKSHKKDKGTLGELSTLPNAEVKVFKDGRIKVMKYAMDDSEDENKLENTGGNEVHSKAKRRKTDE